MSKTPVYGIWLQINNRCLRPSVKGYDRYGGRGITICERWMTFENFTSDMGPRPSPVHSVERIDNNGPYCPENCRWATQTEQTRNKRNNHMLTLDGRSMIAADWAKELGISRQTIVTRLSRGWSDEECLTIPIGNNGGKRSKPIHATVPGTSIDAVT